MRPGLNPSEVGHFRSHHVLDVKKMSLEWLSQFCESSPHETAIYGPYRAVHGWDELSHRITDFEFKQSLAKYNSIKLHQCNNRVPMLKKLGVNLGFRQQDMRFGGPSPRIGAKGAV